MKLDTAKSVDLSQLSDADLADLEKWAACYEWSGDYLRFVHECLGRDFPEMNDPGVLSWLGRYGNILNDWLETRQTQRVRRNVIVCVPRGTCKSEGATIPTFPYVHLREPEVAMGLISATFEDMAATYTKPVRAIWECLSPTERLKYFGEFYNPKRKWTDTEMTTAARRSNRKDPTLSASSIDKGMTGRHLDLVIMDDPVTQAKASKEGGNWYRKVWDQYQELNTIVKNNGLFVLVCTRYAENDLVGMIKDRVIAPQVRKLTHLDTKPGDLPDDFEQRWPYYAGFVGWDVIFHQAIEDINDNHPDPSQLDGAPVGQHFVFPVIWSSEAIDQVRLDPERGEAWFAAQLQNTPAERRDAPLKPEHIERTWIQAEDIPAAAYGDLYMTCDIAWKDGDAYIKQTGDWSVIQVWGQEAGKVYLVHGWHGKPSQEEFGEQWLRILEWSLIQHQSRIRACTYDAPIGGLGGGKSGSSIIGKWLWDLANRRGLPCPHLMELKRAKSKIDRMLAVTGYWQDGRVRLMRGVEGARELAHEMLLLGYSAHDDHADAAADAFHIELYKPISGVYDTTAAVGSFGDTQWNWVPEGLPAEDGDEEWPQQMKSW